MSWRRRDFLKMLAAAGISATVLPSKTYAQEAYEGPLLLTINALGGWDVTSLCDPKETLVDGVPMNRMYRGDIGAVGNFHYAPIPEIGTAAFFEKHYRDILMLNGIDMSATGHTEASRHAWSGDLADNNTPSIAALFACAKLRKPDLSYGVPMPFLSFGGYSKTGGLVPLARAGNLTDLSTVALYERDRGIHNGGIYVDDFAQEDIIAARDARHARMHHEEKLPRYADARTALYTSQINASLLRRYREHLPSVNNNLDVSENMAAISLATMKAGITASASVYVGDFDTHVEHDENHPRLMSRLLSLIDYTLTRAEELQLRDRLTIVITSEFSRTPAYNESGNGGKDHWGVNSMMLMGPGIPGNRLHGATDENLLARNVNLDTMDLDSQGERLRPGHIHRSLRKRLEIDDFATDIGLGLRIRDIPLFT